MKFFHVFCILNVWLMKSAKVEAFVIHSPYWLQYCTKWFPSSSVTQSSGMITSQDMPEYLVKQLISNIGSVAAVCAAYTDYTTEKYLETSKVDSEFTSSADHLNLNWIPKSISKLDLQKSKIQFPEALQNTSTIVRHFLIALNVMIMDEALLNSEHVAEFESLRNKLVQLLCETESVMKTFGVVDVTTHDSVPPSSRSLVNKRGQRLLRNWIVLRDLSDAMYTTNQVFSILESQIGI